VKIGEFENAKMENSMEITGMGMRKVLEIKIHIICVFIKYKVRTKN
jgi:hypothetical protein